MSQQRFQPIQWARQATLPSGDAGQDPADGSRLLDCYAVNPAAIPSVQFQPKVPVILNQTHSWHYMSIPNGIRTIGAPKVDNTGLPLGAPAFQVMGVEVVKSNIYGEYAVFLTNDGRLCYSEDGEEYQQAVTYTTEATDYISSKTRIATDGRHSLFVGGRNAYMFDYGTKQMLTQAFPVPDNPREGGGEEEWADVAWIDGYFILAAKGGQFFHSAQGGTTFDQLDFASAEVNPDRITGIIPFRRRLYVFGENSVENWANTGGADFAFSRDNSFVVEQGCLAPATIQKTEDAIYFLGRDGIVYAMGYGQPQRVSHEGVEASIPSDQQHCYAFTYTEGGHKFYSLVLAPRQISQPGVAPSFEGFTNWVLDTTTGFWHERNGSTGGRVLSVFKYMNDAYCSLWSDEHVRNYSARVRDFTIDRVSEVIAPPIHADQMAVSFNALKITTTAPPGTTTGYAELSSSDDGGNTWVDHGRISPLAPEMRWNRLGQTTFGRNFRLRWASRFTPSSGEPINILGAYVSTSGRSH